MSDRECAPSAGAFDSILFPGSPRAILSDDPPECFHDLNLDQIVATATAGWEEYDLPRFFYTAPTDPEVIGYRQDVMRELERAAVMERLLAFSRRMRTMRLNLEAAKQSTYHFERARWFLAAVATYSGAVRCLSQDLTDLGVRSRGLRSVRDYVAEYITQPAFAEMTRQAGTVATDLAAVRYLLSIHGLHVTVLPYDGETDYAAEVERTFDKFRRGSVVEHRTAFADAGRLNHVEAQVLDNVARLHPAPFAALDAFCAGYTNYLDARVEQFDQELPFYLAYLSAIVPVRRAGLAFSYPELSTTDKQVEARQAFDLALAWKLVAERRTVVCNDFHLENPQRIFVVSGPNHGGKTTFARMFGQLHYLARLGCPVPGSASRLFICDRVFTHFERVEDIRYERGKLQDDLIRIHRVLDQETSSSIVIMNEIFASTTLQDAVYLGVRVMADLSRRDVLAVCVTFLDELAAFDEKTVSLVSAVDPHDLTVRTFKLERRPADGLAYAVAIAEKYRVTAGWLQRRLRP